MKFAFVKYFVLLIVLVGAGHLVQAQSEQVLELTNIHIDELQVAGFKLNQQKSIKIDALGAGRTVSARGVRGMMQDPSGMFAYGWIINAQTRELVWQMTTDNTSRADDGQFTRRFKGQISLPEGEYEVYYFARKPDLLSFKDGFFSLGRLLNLLLRGEDWLDLKPERWYIKISGVDEVASSESVAKFHKARKNQAVISITDLTDSDFRQQGFTLTEEGLFDVYAIGEAYQGEEFDYGWIVRADDSEKIWEMIEEQSKHAGGALKNRVWKTQLHLYPGNYWVYFVTDDSHAPDAWNANPPFDPDFWGITITGVAGKYNPRSVKELLKFKITPIVDLTRAGNSELLEAAFRLDEEMKIRIHAVGEGRDGEMFDYGWIVDKRTGKTIWKMTYERTRHGGGADKNRMTDEIITLPAGEYIVYFKTDDSHAYRDWNAAPPYNPSHWGIAVYPADPRYSEKKIHRLKEIAPPPNVIAQIIRVRDDEHVRKRFKLAETTRIRIYAIGEGDWDEMYDYGWIENLDTGEIVWEMRYEKTRWAGGARKNRKVDTVIELPPGNYEVHYRTDDSHSFNDWNDDPPDDLLNYGITLYRVQE